MHTNHVLDFQIEISKRGALAYFVLFERCLIQNVSNILVTFGINCHSLIETFISRMDSFKSTLARQKFGNQGPQGPQQPPPQLKQAPHTGTQPLNIGSPAHAAPPPQLQTGNHPLNIAGPAHAAPQPQAAQAPQNYNNQQLPLPQAKPSTSNQSLIHSPPMSAPRATSTVQLMMHSPPMAAPSAENQGPPSTQAIGTIPDNKGTGEAQSIFDVLQQRQISFSNNYIKNMNFKAEMFTRDEAKKLPLHVVFLHSDGVVRYHQQVRGEIRQTPLFIMDA